MLGRDRLRADAGGVEVVAGLAGRRRLAWSELERIRVDERTRLGVRSDLLELDAGEEIYLFSRYDLGADPQDALRGADRGVAPVSRPRSRIGSGSWPSAAVWRDHHQHQHQQHPADDEAG